jgi:soluble lytic murein transglycosylase-like protein
MDYITMILNAAKIAKTSGIILLAICTHETGLTNVTVQNDGGTPTYGICQVKLETAQMLGFEGKAKQLLVPKENAKWAAVYLKHQFDRYDGDWCRAIAAYNAGKFNESKKFPGYPRNLKYVNKVKEKLTQPITDTIACNGSNTAGEYAENNGP